jgi:hypothetical protein
MNMCSSLSRRDQPPFALNLAAILTMLQAMKFLKYTVLGLGLLVAACSSEDSRSIQKLSESVNNACPAAPVTAKGTKAAGATCAGAEECKASCCSCGGVGTNKMYLGAACIDQKCADTGSACEVNVGTCPTGAQW